MRHLALASLMTQPRSRALASRAAHTGFLSSVAALPSTHSACKSPTWQFD